MKTYYLTTVDNPFDPTVDYIKWQQFDENFKGYFTSSLLARIAKVSDNLSDSEIEEEKKRSMSIILNELIPIDRQGNVSEYKIIVKEE